MDKRPKARRHFWTSFLALTLSFVMLCSTFPAGALTLDEAMLNRIMDFFQNKDSGKLDTDDYKDFIKDYLEEIDSMEAATAETLPDGTPDIGHDGKTYLEWLHELITDNDGVPEYGKLTDMFKKDPNESDSTTIQTVLGVLQKVESVEEVLSSVTRKRFLSVPSLCLILNMFV